MDDRTRIREEERHKVLGIAHMAFGGFSALMGLLSLFQLVLGIGLMTGWITLPDFPDDFRGQAGWFLIGASLVVFLGGLVVGGLNFLAGQRLRQHRSREVCVTVSFLNLLLFPFGTLLGAFTLVLLHRDTARAVFEDRAHEESPQPAT